MNELLVWNLASKGILYHSINATFCLKEEEEEGEDDLGCYLNPTERTQKSK